MPASLLLRGESGLWVDAHSIADLAAAEHPGVREWAGMVGATDAACRDRVPAARQLFYLDRRSAAGTSADGPVRRIPLGEVAESLGRMGESVAGAESSAAIARLLLDGAGK